MSRTTAQGEKGARLALLAALLPALGACAAPGSDVHVAPLYSRLAKAGGASESEALFGVWSSDDASDFGAESEDDYAWRHGVRPFYSHTDRGDGRWVRYVLPPLGVTYHAPDQTMSVQIPLWIFRKRRRADGLGTEWEGIFVTGTGVRKTADGRLEVAQFPLWGELENFVTFSDVRFLLFPLYVEAKKDGRQARSILFPLISWTDGAGMDALRIFPLYGHARWEGRYERWFLLWPFFHRHRNNLGGGGELPEEKWLLFPLAGATKRGTYRSWSVLWPFFGYAKDPRNDFWALDAPWPFIRIQRGGERPAGEERTRVWPFYSHLYDEGIEWESYAWPLVHRRREWSPFMERDSFYVLPFWKWWHRVDAIDGSESSWRQLWPFYEHWDNIDGRTRTAFPSLWLQRSAFVEYHLAWIWELFSVTESARGRSERSWGGLWRRERDAGEDRRSLAGLWSDRRYVDERGARVKETSLLFGLLRWRRTSESGTHFIRPAFPGPGWPAERAPASESRTP